MKSCHEPERFLKNRWGFPWIVTQDDSIPPENSGKSMMLKNNSESHASQDSEFRVMFQNFTRYFNSLSMSNIPSVWCSNQYNHPNQSVPFLNVNYFPSQNVYLCVSRHSISCWTDVRARRPWPARTGFYNFRISTFWCSKILFSKGWDLKTVQF